MTKHIYSWGSDEQRKSQHSAWGRWGKAVLWLSVIVVLISPLALSPSASKAQAETDPCGWRVDSVEYNRGGLEEARQGCAAWGGSWCSVNVPLWQNNVSNAERRLAECREQQAQKATPAPQATPAPTVTPMPTATPAPPVVVDLKDALEAGLRIPFLIEGGNLSEALYGRKHITPGQALDTYRQECGQRLDVAKEELGKGEQELERLQAVRLRLTKDPKLDQLGNTKAMLESEWESRRKEGQQSLQDMLSDLSGLVTSATGLKATEKLVDGLSPGQIKRLAETAKLTLGGWGNLGTFAKAELIAHYLDIKRQQGGLQGLDQQDKALLGELAIMGLSVAGGPAAGITAAAGSLVINASAAALIYSDMRGLRRAQNDIDNAKQHRELAVSRVDAKIRAQEQRNALLKRRREDYSDQLRRLDGLLAGTGR